MAIWRASKSTFEIGGQEFPRVSWWKVPGMRGLYVRLMFAILTSATNGYDGSMMNNLQSLPQWKDSFNQPDASSRGLLNAIMSVGSIVALPIVPYVADYLGRRTGVMIGCVIMILGVILQSISINLSMFIAARFFIGFGVAIAHGAAPLLVTELVHPQHRAIYTTIYNCTWYWGSIVAAWLTYGTFQIAGPWSWRIPSLGQALPSVIQIIFIWFVPESPRYLIAKGKHEKALNILAKAHAQSNKEDEVVQIEYREIQETIKLEQEFEGNGWTELWRTPGNRHRLVILISLGFFSQWSGNGLVSYYMTDVLNAAQITNTQTQLAINGILNIINALVAFVMCFFVDKLGRRPLFLVATGGMCLSFIVWTITARYAANKIATAANAEVAFIFIFYVFYNLAWSGLLVGYGVEILPYNIRAKVCCLFSLLLMAGLTIMFLAIDLALFFNSYVNPIALVAIGWKYYIVYVCWLAFELAVVWKFYIETRNTPLEEIVRHFDGEGAILGGDLANEKSRQLERELGIYNDASPKTGTHGEEKVVVAAAHVEEL